jgi:hypothetical protein
VVVQIAHGGGCCVGVGELCEAESFGTTRLFVVDQAEAEDLPDATEGLHNLLFGDA